MPWTVTVNARYGHGDLALSEETGLPLEGDFGPNVGTVTATYSNDPERPGFTCTFERAGEQVPSRVMLFVERAKVHLLREQARWDVERAAEAALLSLLEQESGGGL